jgi:deoxyribose-phosphate aldolase
MSDNYVTETKNKIIALGADHGGFALKENLKVYLQEKDWEIADCGTDSDDAVDYPTFAYAVARNVADGKAEFGIMIDGAGIGSAMTANKVAGVRAALCYDISTARNAREHNNANILTLGAGMIALGLAQQIVDTFLNTVCKEDRHLRRVALIDKLDDQKSELSDFEQIKFSETGEKEMDGFTNEDIARIAERISRMMNITTDSAAGQTVCTCDPGTVCRCGISIEEQPDTIRKFIDFGVDRIGISDISDGDCVPEDIARCIDHTVLKPDATEDDIRKLCAEAREYKFASVCVSPSYVKLAARELEGSSVKVCTVVGFPSGAHAPEVKAMEARRAIRDGAEEIDMVINIGALKSGNDELVYRDIRMVCEACKDGSAISKIIIEAALLDEDEKVRACTLARKAKANYVKTSTGFGPGGATAEDVALMSKVVGQAGIGVKAAGGIKSYEDAQKMIEAGATRIGASAGIKILQQAQTSVTISN